MVSIIIPAYNAESYIDQALNSVENQTYKDTEIIVVNDGSTDNTENLIREHMKLDQRIIFINQENHGVSYSRNIGLKKARGEYIFFMDADDLIANECLEIMVKYMEMETSEADIVHVGYESFKDDSSISTSYRHNKYSSVMMTRMQILEEVASYKSENTVHLAVWGYLFKKAMFNDIIFPENMIRGEDEVVMTKLLSKCRNGCFIKNKLYYYRLHEDSAIHKKDSKIIIDEVQALRERILHFQDCKMDELAQKAFDSYVGFIIRDAYKLIVWNKGLKEFKKLIYDEKIYRKELSYGLNFTIFQRFALSSVVGCFLAKIILKVTDIRNKNLF